MNDGEFTLRPFPTAGSTTDLRITGNIARRSNTLTLRYVLLGNLAAAQDCPTRQDAIPQGRTVGRDLLRALPGRQGMSRVLGIQPFAIPALECLSLYSLSTGDAGGSGLCRACRFASSARKTALSLVLELNLDKIIPADRDPGGCDQRRHRPQHLARQPTGPWPIPVHSPTFIGETVSLSHGDPYPTVRCWIEGTENPTRSGVEQCRRQPESSSRSAAIRPMAKMSERVCLARFLDASPVGQSLLPPGKGAGDCHHQ